MTIAETPVHPGLRFFGETTASATHEFKNALAIIQESAGLVADYTAMAARGRPVDFQRFEVAAGRIREQVIRANTLLNHLNRFAHSVDACIGSVDLDEAIGQAVAMSARRACMKNVTFRHVRPRTTVAVTTRPFDLFCLLTVCLRFSMDCAGKGGCVDIASQGPSVGLGVGFGSLESLSVQPPDAFPDRRFPDLLAALDAWLELDVEHKRFIVRLGAP